MPLPRHGREFWFGQVLLVFSYALPSAPTKQELAVLVRWYCAAPHTPFTARTRLQRLRWEMVALPGRRGARTPRCDVVAEHNIAEPVHIVPDPTAEDHFFFNHHVRVGGR